MCSPGTPSLENPFFTDLVGKFFSGNISICCISKKDGTVSTSASASAVDFRLTVAASFSENFSPSASPSCILATAQCVISMSPSLSFLCQQVKFDHQEKKKHMMKDRHL